MGMVDNIFLADNSLNMPVAYVWEDRLMYIGKLRSDTKCYSRSVYLFALSLKNSIQIKNCQQADKQACSAFLVPPGVSHQAVFAADDIVAWMLIEPSSLDCQQIIRQMQEMQNGIYFGLADIENIQHAFLSIYEQRLTSIQAYDMQMQALSLAYRDNSSVRDMRVLQIMQTINKRIQDNINAEELAEAVGLSSSRMQQLFKEQAQMPMSQYRLWRRLKYACQISASVRNFAEVAEHAGFADAAHFSRGFQKMFGRPASSMLGKAVGLNIIN